MISSVLVTMSLTMNILPLTSLIPIGSLLFIGSFVLGAETLTEFALALFIGVAIGTYSSIFIAAPLLVRFKEGEDEWVRTRRRVQRRRGLEPEEEEEEVPVAETAVEVVDRGAVPRPPKQRRKRR